MADPPHGLRGVQDADEMTLTVEADHGLVLIGVGYCQRRLHARAREEFTRLWMVACAEADAYTATHPEEAEDG